MFYCPLCFQTLFHSLFRMQGTMQASERGNMTGSEMLIMQQNNDWAFRLNPVFGGLNYEGILVMFVELNLEPDLNHFGIDARAFLMDWQPYRV